LRRTFIVVETVKSEKVRWTELVARRQKKGMHIEFWRINTKKRTCVSPRVRRVDNIKIELK